MANKTGTNMQSIINQIKSNLEQGKECTLYKGMPLDGKRYALCTYARPLSGSPNLTDVINKVLEINKETFRIKTNEHPCGLDVVIDYITL